MTEGTPAVKKNRKAAAEAQWEAITQKPAVVPDDQEPQGATVDLPPTGKDAPDGYKHEAVADMQANRGLRAIYAGKAYELAVGCISMWAVLLAAQGIIKAMTGVEMLSDKVIIAVTAGVTVNVLAAFLGVIRGLFPVSERKK